MILSISQSRERAEACMRAGGHSHDEAVVIADHPIDCELRGLSFGGLPRALSVIDRLREMTMPRRPISVLEEAPAAAPAPLAHCGLFIIVVDPALLGPADDFKQRVSGCADSLRETQPLDPGQPVRVPFGRSVAERSRRLAADAIELPDAIHAALRENVTAGAPA